MPHWPRTEGRSSRWPSAQISAEHRLLAYQQLSLWHTSCWVWPPWHAASKWPITHTPAGISRPSTWSLTAECCKVLGSGVSGVQFMVKLLPRSFLFLSLHVEIFPNSYLTFGNFMGTFWKSVQIMDIFWTLFLVTFWKDVQSLVTFWTSDQTLGIILVTFWKYVYT